MITINRAVNKGNKPALISQLAHEVAKKCVSASGILQVNSVSSSTFLPRFLVRFSSFGACEWVDEF